MNDLAGETTAKRPWRWWEVALAVGFNLVPVIGVLFWGWSAFALLLLYWLENVVVGVFTVARMLAAGAVSSIAALSLPGALALSAFFTVHYGLFCFVHGIFVLSMFEDSAPAVVDSPFDFTGLLALFDAQPGLKIGLASIILWQAAQYLIFLLRGEAKTAGLRTLMFAPYPRMIVLHVTIIFGAMLVMALNQPVAGVAALALFKTLYDVGAVMGFEPRIKLKTAPEAQP